MNDASGSREVAARTECAVGDCLIPYVKEPQDRASVSLVCKPWHNIDSLTRKHVTISLCYAATPDLLLRRFPNLESLKLKGEPHFSKFSYIPVAWGGHAKPWIEEIVKSFKKMKALHLRRMKITDSDLELIAATEIGKGLEVLKLDCCYGFSTDGLSHICRSLRSLRTLDMEWSNITDLDGQWLHELALNNKVLQTLNVYMTGLVNFPIEDLELIAKNCASLVNVKVCNSIDIADLIGFFRNAAALEEFWGGIFGIPPEGDVGNQNALLERYAVVAFSQKLCSWGTPFMENEELQIVFPFAARLKQLDLLLTELDAESHCQLLERCPNLEMLQGNDTIGDRGLEIVAQKCKKLKRLMLQRVGSGPMITHRGLMFLSHGCLELEYLSIHASNITNASLESVGTQLKKLYTFHLELPYNKATIANFPLDNGVRSLLMGCDKLTGLSLYLQPGGLTDVGFSYIGKYSTKVRRMRLGFVRTDNGIKELSKDLPSLQMLELRRCYCSEGALGDAILAIPSLRYFWAQGYTKSGADWDKVHKKRPKWITEFIPAAQVSIRNETEEYATTETKAEILGYYSLADRRTDFPSTVVPFIPKVRIDE